MLRAGDPTWHQIHLALAVASGRRAPHVRIHPSGHWNRGEGVDAAGLRRVDLRCCRCCWGREPDRRLDCGVSAPASSHPVSSMRVRRGGLAAMPRVRRNHECSLRLVRCVNKQAPRDPYVVTAVVMVRRCYRRLPANHHDSRRSAADGIPRELNRLRSLTPTPPTACRCRRRPLGRHR